MNPDVILAVDPGLASGVALVGVGETLNRAALREWLDTGSLASMLEVRQALPEEQAALPWHDRPLVPLWTGECEWEETWDVVCRVGALGAHRTIRVVAERFVITPQTAKKSQAPWSLEVIGMLRGLVREHDLGTLKLQGAEGVKTMLPNPRLRDLGLWHKGGEGHALDALRHAAFALISSGWRGPGV